MMQPRRAHETKRSPVRGILAVLALLAAAVSVSADDTFRGAAEVGLRARVHAAFPDAAPGPHRYTFFATEDTVVSASVSRDAGSGLEPTLRLTHPGGLHVDLGRTLRATPRGERIRAFTVPYAGFYVLEVAARKGSGGYTLTTRGRMGRRMTGLYPSAPSGDGEFAFSAPMDTRVSVRVAPQEKGPRIEITGITRPGGGHMPVLSLQSRRAAMIRDVPLPEDGRFRLTWTNYGTPGDLKLKFRFRRPAATRGTRQLGVSDGLAVNVIETGDPSLAARDGYVGSMVCGRCHGDLVRSWSSTAHNSAVRSWNRAGLSGALMANDADGNGVDDFRDGLDLATTPAFAGFGPDAPKLSYVAGADVPYRVRIGATTYTVDRTMGGNGLWAQRYLTRNGKSYRVLPFQFDETARTYSAYATDDWYDDEDAPLTTLPADATFAAQCSGCHETGETLGAAAGTGEIVTGYVELNIGCEQCHGPGAEHAQNGDIRKIKNPRRVLEANRTPAGVAAANDVCGRCHTNGASKDALPGTTTTAQFGYLRTLGVAQAYDSVAAFIDGTMDPADFFDLKPSALPAIPGLTSLAARTDRQQANDIAAGDHAPNSADAAACFDCHDPHARRNAHQVATTVERGARVVTRDEDNSLCLSCHAGDGKFPGISTSDAAAIAAAAVPPPAVAAAVVRHMKDAGMPVLDAKYDPAGTGVGRCTTCHMPRTPANGSRLPDRGGFAAGDLHSHRFEIVWPNASQNFGVTNSCSVCHPVDEQDLVGPILTQWAADPGPSHAAVPGATQDGRGLNLRSNPGGSAGGVLCISCHSAEGFTRLQIDGETLAQDTIDEIASSTLAQGHSISCDACHGHRDDGVFYGVNRNPLRVAKEELCGRCHNAETVTFDDFDARGEVVRHPQLEMLAGTAGAASPGAPAVTLSTHSLLPDGCVTCHYPEQRDVARHDFRPDVATCATCHTNLDTFDRTAAGDFDGNGLVEGVQTEVTGLLDLLRSTLLNDAQIAFDGAYFDYGGASDHALSGASPEQKRAVYNWYSVSGDKSRGVHNTARAVQLLQRSYKELTGVDVPGAALR